MFVCLLESENDLLREMMILRVKVWLYMCFVRMQVPALCILCSVSIVMFYFTGEINNQTSHKLF